MPPPDDRGPRAPISPAAEGATLPSDPELANAPTVVAITVATEGRKKKPDPFTLVSGESISPQVDARAADLDTTSTTERYERGPIIGAGGMGEVRLQTDRRIGRRVAKKTLHSTLDSSVSRQRFLREARVQGQLEHPAIVPVYDLDVDEHGQVFFTMKRVRGFTLERVLERLRAGDPEAVKKFSTRKLLTAFAQVCLAIDYAHTRGVLHRDLKPGNIMLGDFGEVYVLDWGLAKVATDPDDEANAFEETHPVVGASAALTKGGALLGTPAYMSPEQLFRKTDEIDARSDVFALGAILYEIVTRSMLRKSHEVAEIQKAVVRGEDVRPSERAPDVAPELDEICARALAKDMEDRPPRARDLAEAIERYLDGEHDANLRRELSVKHAAAARKRAEVHEAPARVEAFRETMQALAFDQSNEDAQKLMVELLTDVSGNVPDAAQREFTGTVDHKRAEGARAATLGLLLWLAILPAVIFIGVRNWPAVIATGAFTAAAAALSYRMSKRPRYGMESTIPLSGLLAAVVAMTSCYLGPFAVVPTCAATASIQCGIHATRRERPWLTGVIALGALAPFVAEILGIFPRAYQFNADGILVFARAVALPEGATHAAMIYSTLSFTIFAAWLIGRMRDALLVSEKRHFLQAWYLRELFPAGQRKAT